jgi:hypothetical protein
MKVIFYCGLIVIIIGSIYVSLQGKAVTPTAWYILAIWFAFCVIVDKTKAKQRNRKAND